MDLQRVAELPGDLGETGGCRVQLVAPETVIDQGALRFNDIKVVGVALERFQPLPELLKRALDDCAAGVQVLVATIFQRWL